MTGNHCWVWLREGVFVSCPSCLGCSCEGSEWAWKSAQEDILLCVKGGLQGKCHWVEGQVSSSTVHIHFWREKCGLLLSQEPERSGHIHVHA